MAALSFLVLGSTSGWAALGQPATSIARDRQRMGGELRATAALGFSVQEISSPDGIVVREYVSPAGQVFGVSWSGPARPNLIDLLGDYYPAFQQAARPPIRRRGSLVVRTGPLVVEMGGQMRALHGRAYLADRLPAAVSAAVVR
jgi:hypothetical protein